MTAAVRSLPTTDVRPACTGKDPELFWPRTPTSIDGRDQIARALAVCHHCPIQPACLAAAERRDRADRRGQVIGGRWFNHRGKPSAVPPPLGRLSVLNRPEARQHPRNPTTEETR